MIQLIDERRFDLVAVAYTGLLFPNPETTVHSSLADPDNTNNITAVKNDRIDELLEAYDKEFDQGARETIIREIDEILANLHHYILGWEAPFYRIAFWNKFGQPDGYLSRFGYYRDPLTLWWIDPQQEARFREGMGSASSTLEVGETDVHYWEQYVDRIGQELPTPGIE
jgi:microcin C transport system substrate-binding protein